MKITIHLFLMFLAIFLFAPRKSSANFNANYSEIGNAGQYFDKFVLAKSNIDSQNMQSISGDGIGLPGPILSNIRIANGKRVCGKTNDHPQRSKKNPPGHIDSECCLDPDETPNSLCYYPMDKYGNLIQKYLKRKK